MIFRVCFLLTISSALLFVRPARGAERSLSFGEIEITLGMRRESVVKRLESQYDLTPIQDGYFIKEKKRDETSAALGTVMFRNGRVSNIGKSLGNFWAKESVELGYELQSALERLQSATRGVIVVSPTKRRAAPGVRITSIQCSSDAGSVNLNIIEGKDVSGGPSIDLQEALNIK